MLVVERNRRAIGIGLSDLTKEEETIDIRNVATEPVWLTVDVLERLWKRMTSDVSDDVELVQLLSRVRRAPMDGSHFHVLTTDIEVQTALVAQKERVLQMLHKLTNNREIDFDICYEEVKKNTEYDPEEKYRNMLEKNAAMHQLRQLFPDLEIG